MSSEFRPAHRLLAIATTVALAGLLGGTALAQQQKPQKKLYCWDEGGRRVCGDTLPASAAGAQRTEFDQRTGTATNRVSRALTDEERAQAAAQAEAQRAAADQLRREQAMVQVYDTEDDLKRAFQNRFELADESLKASALARKNLQASLIVLLQQANELELSGKPVPKKLRDKIQGQHRDLLALEALQQKQATERASLQQEFDQAVTRYRELKNATNPGATASAAPAATPTPATGG